MYTGRNPAKNRQAVTPATGLIRTIGPRVAPPATGRRMHPIMGRWGMRGMEDFTVEALARLHQTRDGGIRQRTPQTERTRRRPWVMQPNTAHPA